MPEVLAKNTQIFVLKILLASWDKVVRRKTGIGLRGLEITLRYFTVGIILEITLTIVLKKVFQTIIGNQRDFNEIVSDDVEVKRNVNGIRWRSGTVDVCSRTTFYYKIKFVVLLKLSAFLYTKLIFVYDNKHNMSEYLYLQNIKKSKSPIYNNRKPRVEL